MATTPDDILINAVMQAESRGKRFDKAGNLLTSVKGAQGEMQVMPTTQTKPGFGVKPAQDSSAEEKARVGRDYLKAMISKYGDTTTALAAYNWGPGRVNKWLEKGGDFNKLPEETKKYIKTIQASLPKGTQLASAPPVKVKPPIKASTNRVAPAAPAKPPVSITKEMVADLGPNYQAALAAMALGDTREDDDDEESIAERYAAKQERLAEEAASVPPPRIAGMELTYQSPFPEEQIAQAPEGLAHGGVPRRGNSARDALRMMKEAQRLQQQQPVQRADGSPEEGEKDLSEDPIGDFLNKYELEQLRKKIAENDAAIKDLEPVPTEVETGSDPMLLDISPARKRAIEANPELFEYGTAQLKDEEYARPMLRNDPDTFNENWLEYKLRPRGQSDFSNKYPPGMELSMPYPRTPVKPKRWEAWDQYYAAGGVVRRAEGSPEEGEKTKLPEGGDSVRSRDVEDLLGSVVGMNLPERGKVLASNLRFTPTEGLNIGAINTLVQGMSPKDIRQFMLNLDVADKAGINLTKEGLQDIYANIKGENNTNYQASYNPRGKAVSLQRMGKEGNFGVTLSPDYQGAYYQSQFADGGVVRRADGSPEEGEKAAATARDLYAQIKRSGESIDEGGLKYWTERAQSNQQSPEELQKAFMAAADVADDPYYEVNRMYQRINQTPDTEGFNYWVNRAQQEKLTPQQLGSQFIGGMPAITQAENRPGFGVGGQYGTYNGLPMLYAPEVDRVMDREQRVTGDLVNKDNAIGWDPSSMSGELSRGAAAAGVYRTPFRMGGEQQAFQGDLVGTAKQYGIDPEQYMQPTAGQYGQPAGSALNENALYKALDEKMKDYYAVQGYVPPAGTANSAFNRTDIGGDHARVMYQRVGDRLVPMENTLQYSNMQRAPKYSWTDYIAPAAIVAAPWALPYLSTIASAVNWGPIGAEVGKGALIGAGKSIIQGQNPITGAIQGGASGLIPSPFAAGGPVYRAGGSPEEGERLTGVNKTIDFVAQKINPKILPTSARTFLETVQGTKTPITEANFSAKELDAMRQLIDSTSGRGSVKYDDYTAFMQKQQKEKGTIPASIAPNILSALDPIGNVQTTLGRFTYSRDPDGNLVVVDKYDFNPIQSMSGAFGALRNYATEKIPPGKGRDVRINLGSPVKRAGGSPEIGEYYQDPMGMDTGPVTADTTKALQLRQGLSAKEALGTVKNIAKEGVSNAESLGRGSAASFPGLAGDVESFFRDEKKRKFKTTDEILKTEMPKRMTTPTKEAAGFEQVGTYIDPTTGLPFVKGAAKAALAGLKASGPQVEKALMKVAPGAKPMYAVKPGGGTFFPKGSGSRVDDYLESIVQALPQSGIDVPGKDLTTIADFIRNKGHKYFTSEYGTLNDSVRAAVSEGRMPVYGKDEEVFRDYLLQAAREGSPNAMKDLEKFYDTRTALRGDVMIPSEELAKDFRAQFNEAEKAREKLNTVFNQQGVLPEFRNPNLLGKDEKLLSESYSIPPNKQLAALLKGERAPASAAEEAMLFAAKNKEPIYDFNSASPDMQMFNPKDIARGIAALLQKGTKASDLDKMTFPEALVRGAQETKVYRNLDDAVEKLDQGKTIPQMWFTQGVTTVIPKLPKSSNTWVKLDTPAALRIEAAAMNHSIDGYAKKGKYGAGGLEAFLKGDVEVYSLRNAEKKPLTTVEVKVEKGKNLLSQIRNRFNSVPNEEQQLEVFQLLDKLKPAEIWPVTYKRDAFGTEIEPFDVSWRSLYRDYLDKNKSLD